MIPRPPPRQPFQFTLRTLLLLFVLLGLSLGVFGAWGIVVFALVVGLAAYIRYVESLPSPMQLILLLFCLFFLLSLLLPALNTSRERARGATCLSNLKQIALAIHQYRQVNGCFPPACIADKNGKPMHSWRVLVLPYLDQAALYKTYDFSVPWDAPKNRGSLSKCPKVYICPSDPPISKSAIPTSYVAVVGSGAAWAGEKSRIAAGDFPGGLRDTILLVEVAGSGIAWTEPKDLALETFDATAGTPAALAVSSRHHHSDSFFITYTPGPYATEVMADGHVRNLSFSGLSSEDLPRKLKVGGWPEEALDLRDGEVCHLNWPNIAALAVWLLSVGTLLTGAVRSRKPHAVPPPVG